MGLKNYITLYLLFLVGHAANSQIGGYTIIFGGSFKHEKVSIECSEIDFSQKLVLSVDKSTSLNKGVLFFDSSFFGHKVLFKFKGIKKKRTLILKDTNTIMYVYFWYYRKKLSYEILPQMLDLN